MYTKYTGIILKKYPFGEADELLTIYTRESGKMRVKTRSTRKIHSRLAGHLQSLNEIDFETASRARASAIALPVITSVRALTINSYLRENLRKFAFALVGIETLYRICADHEPNLEIYNALVNFLKTLGNMVNENLAVRQFQLELLSASGYALPGLVLQSGEPVHRLTGELEKEIDQMLEYVLEREIKSSKFLSEV